MQLTFARMNIPLRVEVLLCADSPSELGITPDQTDAIALAVRNFVTATKRFS